MREPLEVGEPELDEWTDRVFEARGSCDLERLFVARPCLGRIDALLQSVVARDQQLLDTFAWVLSVVSLHKRTLTRHIYRPT